MSAIQQLRVHRFSVEQYYELGKLGLLNQRTELLEGSIIDMEPIAPYRANVGDHFFPNFSATSSRSVPSMRPVSHQPGPPKPTTA
jgi:hypothetical protein